MAEPTARWPIILSQRLYRALLRAYPPDFRHRHGAAMAQLFGDVCRDAQRERGGRGLLAIWRHTLGDLCVSVFRERRATLLDALRRATGRHPGGLPWAAPPPDLGALLRVLPIGRTQQVGRWSLTFVSVEHWGGACVASFTVRWRTAPGAASAPPPLVGLDLRAIDDRGGRYLARQCGGSGGADSDSGHMDLAYALTPALDPAARSLRLAARVQLLAQEGSPPRLVPLRTEPGQWDVTVAIPATATAAVAP
jgi:hypothetical protein